LVQPQTEYSSVENQMVNPDELACLKRELQRFNNQAMVVITDI